MSGVATDRATDRLDRLRLIRTLGVGPVTYRQLLARFGTPAAALDALPDLARRGGGRPVVPDAATAAREVETVARLGARHLFLDDADYPSLLAQLDDAPAVVTVRGDPTLAARPAVAMVGARNASAAACRFARALAHDLAARGATVVSGLARGIDSAAHHGAMPATVAVIAGGIDVVYPPENAALQDRIAADGLLVAEMPPGVEPRARHFPHRNRIIAGLSLGTLVVEAAPRSGSLITARLAGEAGREVMAVPGHPSDPRAAGCNGLIRDGATLVQDADDVMELLRPIDPRAVRAPAARWDAGPPQDATDAERRRLAALLGAVPVPVDELVRQSGLAPSAVQIVLLELELAGRLERHAGGRVSLHEGNDR
ncbi:DNA processing protein DprA [Sphingomonas sp. Leaf412]|uniref:DNA-processing protein DprA n=1 Tax=Sphingomonas sp. Leaf412 TaxID=1736370 RepID=UPI0006F573BD|nr:DNA-processing protein DprA [Sphingomonas sp. Leaf412]KQT31937.1 DNA processing protein DprA [Sphingomonas sp. Leaf412]